MIDSDLASALTRLAAGSWVRVSQAAVDLGDRVRFDEPGQQVSSAYRVRDPSGVMRRLLVGLPSCAFVQGGERPSADPRVVMAAGAGPGWVGHPMS
jgi:hypothetical protein